MVAARCVPPRHERNSSKAQCARKTDDIAEENPIQAFRRGVSLAGALRFLTPFVNTLATRRRDLRPRTRASPWIVGRASRDSPPSSGALHNGGARSAKGGAPSQAYAGIRVGAGAANPRPLAAPAEPSPTRRRGVHPVGGAGRLRCPARARSSVAALSTVRPGSVPRTGLPVAIRPDARGSAPACAPVRHRDRADERTRSHHVPAVSSASPSLNRPGFSGGSVS